MPAPSSSITTSTLVELLLDRQPGPVRVGVLGDIRERLLHDAEHLKLLRDRQAQLGHMILESQVHMRELVEREDTGTQRVLQPQRVDRRAEMRQHFAQVGMRAAHRLPHLGAICQGGNLVVGRNRSPAAGQPHLDEGQGLGNGVVDLGRHRLAFAQHRGAQGFPLEQGVVKREPQQLADRLEQRHRFRHRLPFGCRRTGCTGPARGHGRSAVPPTDGGTPARSSCRHCDARNTRRRSPTRWCRG